MDGDSLRDTGYLKLEWEKTKLEGEVGAQVCDAAEVTAVCVRARVCVRTVWKSNHTNN